MLKSKRRWESCSGSHNEETMTTKATTGDATLKMRGK